MYVLFNHLIDNHFRGCDHFRDYDYVHDYGCDYGHDYFRDYGHDCDYDHDCDYGRDCDHHIHAHDQIMVIIYHVKLNPWQYLQLILK